MNCTSRDSAGVLFSASRLDMGVLGVLAVVNVAASTVSRFAFDSTEPCLRCFVVPDDGCVAVATAMARSASPPPVCRPLSSRRVAAS
ncbi:hypothetical protein ON010_g14094 [Phytophthora cinnamomi]|nr:hypothetical protein ON010_g14094 [Phytophthora cinnamomi]